MSENGLLGPQADRDYLWRFVFLLLDFDRGEIAIHSVFSFISRSVTAVAATGRRVGIAQNRKYLVRAHPILDINFLVRDSARRLHQIVMLTTTRTELALSMGGNISTDGRCPQVRDVAKKLHRTLFISVLHFAVRGAHTAQRLYATLNTLRHTRTLA